MSQTAETINSYRRRALALIKQSKTEMRVDRLNIFQLADWFLSHHNTWSPATIRQYRAALSQLVRDATEAGRLTKDQGISLAKKLRGRIDQSGRQIAPRPCRTSDKPKKRRSLSPSRLEKLVQKLKNRRTKIADLARLIVTAGPEIGARPCEWITVEVRDGACRMRNAKTTNDRANGETRLIVIPPHQNATELLMTIRNIAEQIPRDVPWEHMQRRLNYVLRRVSRDIGLNTPVSLSTLRHIAIGRWKCAFNPDEVAALAGHASNATAVCHYGRRRSGRKWPPALVRPCRPMLAIRDRFRHYGGRLNSPTVG